MAKHVVTTTFCSVLLFLWFKVNTIATETGPSHGKVIACYWVTWATFRPGAGKFQLENVNPSLCTHLIFAFALLDDANDSLKIIGEWPALVVDENNKNSLTKLKVAHPHLKVMVGLGGWNDGSIKYSKMSADPNRRRNFVNNSINFITNHNFDGMDLFWEFPTKRGGSISDKANFVQLVKELKSEYNKHNLVLSAALGASKDTIDNGYDVPELSSYLDYMFMMCYDYNGWWGRITGANAPLRSSNLLNVEYTIGHMLKLGADPKKLILGIPFYGRTFIMLDANNSIVPPRLGGKFKKDNFKGSFTQESGFMGYNEICLEFFDRNSNWSVHWDTQSETPYAVSGEKLIVFDNERSIGEKVKFAMNAGLGGVMIWSIDTDDFRGDCYKIVDGHADYPLLRTVDREIHKHFRYQQYYYNVAEPVVSGTLVFQLKYFVFSITVLINLI